MDRDSLAWDSLSRKLWCIKNLLKFEKVKRQKSISVLYVSQIFIIDKYSIYVPKIVLKLSQQLSSKFNLLLFSLFSGEVHYNMDRTTWDVRNLLEVFSREFTHKDFCLAHLFTDIKFEGGILGLAYVGSPRRNSVGGICTPEYFKNGYTLYLNSGTYYSS